MSGMDAIYPILFGGACAWGWMLYQRRSQDRKIERWMAAFLPLAFFILIARAVQEMLNAPFQIWDTVRLLPAYLLARGLPIYYPQNAGPVLDQMYGPMTAVAYLPVAWLVRSPDWAAALAKILTILYFFGPMFLLGFFRQSENRGMRLAAIYALLAALYRAVESPVLSGSGFWNHADAPALGLCSLGCLILYWGMHQERWAWNLVSGVFVALSIWTKQVTVPVCVALPLFLLITEGRVAALRYIAALALAGLMTGGVFVAQHGLENLWFNLIANPAQEPWQTDLIKVQGLAIVELMDRARWLALLQAGYVVFEFNRNHFHERWRPWLKENRWIMFTLVAICMVPTSLMGRMKAGGDLNALSFTMYFMLLASLALVLQMVRSVDGSAARAGYEIVGRKLLFGFVVSAILVEIPTVSYSLVRLSRTMQRLRVNPATVAYQYDQKYPGVVYMPWNCLESFLAEGQIYHFEYAVFDRDIADLPVDAQHLKSGVPQRMRYIAYPFNEQARHIMKYFPEYSKQITLPELPGWTVYTQP